MAKIATTSIDQCDSAQLKALLTLAGGGARRSAFLTRELASREDLARQLAHLCDEASDSGELLLSTVCASDTSLNALKGMKVLAKSLTGKASTPSQRAAATFFYHAVVAAALARYGANISSRPPNTRLGLYEDLATFFAGDPLGHVFREATEKASTDRNPNDVPDQYT